ncbi:MAG TPA: tetratricopeptide repeat protein [Mycobacteriales bacterium]|nr:tetratricopeptide repeat protein [Mycobacteriales bacterium]
MSAALVDSARTGLDRERSERAAVPSLVRYAASGPPPLVRGVTDLVGLGVHPAAPGPGGEGGPASRVPPYVPRDADTRLRAAVAAGGLVLLVGESTAGKSRAAFEAVRVVCPDHRLVVPARPDAVADLRPVLAGARRAVVWLDDLERYLGPGGLDLTELTAWLANRDAGQVVVLATIRYRERQRYTRDGAGPGVWRAAREVVEQAAEFDLDRDWSPGELDRAAGFGDDPRIKGALRAADRFGLAEVLAAGPEIARAWKAAWAPGANPRGAALVAAAVDARRAGLDTPLPRDLLIALHEHYLAERGGPLLRPESEADALAWATAPVYATSSPLLPAGDEQHRAFLAFDYLLDLPALPSVPEATHRLLGMDDVNLNIRYSPRIKPYEAGDPGLDHEPVPSWGIPEQLRLCLPADPGLDHKPDPPPVPDSTWTTLVERTTPEQAYRVGRMALDQHRYGSALTAFTRAAGADVPLSRYYLGVILGECGHPDRALLHLRQCLTQDQHTLGPDHPDTLITRHQIAYYTGKTGDTMEALRLMREVFSDELRVYGPDHPSILTTRSQIAYYTGNTGNAAEALNLYHQLLADRERILGPYHPRTMRTRRQVGYWSKRAGTERRPEPRS